MALVEDPHAGLDPASAALEREREEITKVKNVPRIELGRFEMDCWYYRCELQLLLTGD